MSTVPTIPYVFRQCIVDGCTRLGVWHACDGWVCDGCKRQFVAHNLNVRPLTMAEISGADLGLVDELFAVLAQRT